MSFFGQVLQAFCLRPFFVSGYQLIFDATIGT
uniref:Uncharacterized protein n=1 Tax=Arundo donax TaxID=35708 RepID=A0A0A9BEE7_ARUDO